MDVQEAFWELIHELGRSEKELRDFGTHVKFDDTPIITIYRYEINNGRKVFKETFEDTHNWNIAVQYLYEEIDLRDPESFDKLDEFFSKLESDQVYRDAADLRELEKFVLEMDKSEDA